MAAEEASGFGARIQELSAAHEWVLSEVSAKRAVIRFRLASGRTQTLYVIDLGEVVELSVPSALVYDTVDDVPGDLAVTCLRRSAKSKVGFWCLEQIDGKHAFSFMWNLPHRMLDAETFGEVVRALVLRCDELESDLMVDPVQLDQELRDLLHDDGGEDPAR